MPCPQSSSHSPTCRIIRTRFHRSLVVHPSRLLLSHKRTPAPAESILTAWGTRVKKSEIMENHSFQRQPSVAHVPCLPTSHPAAGLPHCLTASPLTTPLVPMTLQVKHLKGVLNFSTVCYVAGLALASVCNPMTGNPIAAVLLSTAIFARWTMVGHHVSHGGYNAQQNGQRFHRSSFAKGPINRALDWLDWMLPEAWDVEHNNLHHYKLGETMGDPDLVERNVGIIRDQGTPQWFKYIQVSRVALLEQPLTPPACELGTTFQWRVLDRRALMESRLVGLRVVRLALVWFSKKSSSH